MKEEVTVICGCPVAVQSAYRNGKTQEKHKMLAFPKVATTSPPTSN